MEFAVIIVLVLLIIATIFVYQVRRYDTLYSGLDFPIVSHRKIKPKTGDIVFYQHDTTDPPHIRYTRMSPFTHIGIIVTRAEIPYICELVYHKLKTCDRILDVGENNSKITPFANRAPCYPGKVYLVSLSRSLDNKRAKTLDKLVENNCEFVTPKDYIFSKLLGLYKSCNLHCFLYISSLLRKCGLLKKTPETKSFFRIPRILTQIVLENDPKKLLLSGYSYQYPVKIDFSR